MRAIMQDALVAARRRSARLERYTTAPLLVVLRRFRISAGLLRAVSTTSFHWPGWNFWMLNGASSQWALIMT